MTKEDLEALENDKASSEDTMESEKKPARIRRKGQEDEAIEEEKSSLKEKKVSLRRKPGRI